MTTPDRSKQRKLERVSLAILKAYAAHPQKKMNVSRIARDQRVSSAWVYKYMGPRPEEILLSAIDTLAPLITELGAPLKPSRDPNEWSRSFFRGLNKTLIEVEEFPDLFRFYFVTCLREGTRFRERIKHHEQLFLSHRAIPRIQTAFGYSRVEARSFASLLLQLRMGLVFEWLTEKEKTTARRRQLLREIKIAIFRRLG